MLLPAVTRRGLSELVTLKSACVPDVTAIFTVAALSARFVSWVTLVTLSVSVIIVPAVVPALTV